jgi:hypothetical protein
LKNNKFNQNNKVLDRKVNSTIAISVGSQIIAGTVALKIKNLNRWYVICAIQMGTNSNAAPGKRSE